MDDEIIINLRALTERQRNNIAKVLVQALNDIEDEINEVALETLQQFVEE